MLKLTADSLMSYLDLGLGLSFALFVALFGRIQPPKARSAASSDDAR